MLAGSLGLGGILIALSLSGCTIIFDESSTSMAVDAEPASPFCYTDEFDCPPDFQDYRWYSYPGSCSCYASTDTFRDAYASEDECGRRDHNGYTPHLLVIDDLAEMNIIDNVANLHDHRDGDPGSFLLGLFYDSAGQQWQWATGEPLDLDITMVNFDPDLVGGQHCAHTARLQNNRWVSWPCDTTGGAIETVCELDGKPVTVAPPPVPSTARAPSD